MPDNEPAPVEFDELLAAEYDYTAQTAIQANEDRARVSSFYMVAVGSLVAALFGTQFFDPNSPSQTVNLIFSGLFVLLTLMGTSTVMQLARLRSSWYESALAMNQFKDYMVSQNPTLNRAFRWKTSTLPSKHKKDSISYYQAIEVALQFSSYSERSCPWLHSPRSPRPCLGSQAFLFSYTSTGGH